MVTSLNKHRAVMGPTKQEMIVCRRFVKSIQGKVDRRWEENMQGEG